LRWPPRANQPCLVTPCVRTCALPACGWYARRAEGVKGSVTFPPNEHSRPLQRLSPLPCRARVGRSDPLSGGELWDKTSSLLFGPGMGHLWSLGMSEMYPGVAAGVRRLALCAYDTHAANTAQVHSRCSCFHPSPRRCAPTSLPAWYERSKNNIPVPVARPFASALRRPVERAIVCHSADWPRSCGGESD
jgi:hypothetical protein